MIIALEIFQPAHPADVTALTAALRQLPLDRIKRLVVLGKTEGPATLNDFSRDLAQAAVDRAIQQVGGEALLLRSVRLFSTGCEGIATPITVFLAQIENGAASQKQAEGLVLGAAESSPVADEDRAGPIHIQAARDSVSNAMADAGIVADQVSLILVKSPILSVAEAERQGGSRRRHGGSTGSARAAAAIGAGLAIGEIDSRSLGPDPIGQASLYAKRVMAFSGTEVDRVETVVLGKRVGGDQRWDIQSKLLEDLLDGDALLQIGRDHLQEIALVLFKAGIPADGNLRGRRTTVLTSELPPDKQLRAAASGLLTAYFSKAHKFISGGAEHLGAPGACLCSVLLRVEPAES
jgi:cyanuric acid amidohydrolase